MDVHFGDSFAGEKFVYHPDPSYARNAVNGSDAVGRKRSAGQIQIGRLCRMRGLEDWTKREHSNNRYGKSACTSTSGASPSGPRPSLLNNGAGRFTAIA